MKSNHSKRQLDGSSPGEGSPAKSRRVPRTRNFSQDQLRTLYEAAAILGTSVSKLPQALTEAMGPLHAVAAGEPAEESPQNEGDTQPLTHPDSGSFALPDSHSSSQKYTSSLPRSDWIGLSDNCWRSLEPFVGSQERPYDVCVPQGAASTALNPWSIYHAPSTFQTGSWANIDDSLWRSDDDVFYPNMSLDLGPSTHPLTSTEDSDHNSNPLGTISLPWDTEVRPDTSIMATDGKGTCEATALHHSQIPAAEDKSDSISSHTEAGSISCTEAGSDESLSGQSTKPHNSPVRTLTSPAGVAEGPKKIGRRGPFRSSDERQQTGFTRRLGACIRCRLQKIRVSIVLFLLGVIDYIPIYSWI